jgi:hypothetical protein
MKKNNKDPTEKMSSKRKNIFPYIAISNFVKLAGTHRLDIQ